jgi:transposase
MVKPSSPVRSRFELHSERVGALPIVNWFLARIGLDDALSTHVPADDRRLRLAPAAALGVVVRNLIVDHEPVYALGEWAAPFDPALLRLEPGDVGLLNDDRVGRSLDRLFDADRASLLTEVVLRAVRAFAIDCSELHNDSTSVTFAGDYRAADGRTRGGKPTAAITFGYNKDHRPDLRQLVWILTVSADGAVPLAHRVVSGNITDDVTHVESWNDLCSLVGRTDFLYVADSKLCTHAAMDHIDARGGRFVTVLPRTRREDRWFRDWLTRNRVSWTETITVPARRRGQPPDVLSVFESPLGSAEGHRVIWIHSTAKAARDATVRTARIETAERDLADLARRLAAPKARIKTRVRAEEAARAIVAETDTTEFFDISISEVADKRYVASHRGSPGPHTTFRQARNIRPRLAFKLRPHAVRRTAAADGCWPLITNDTELNPAEILAAHRYQPHLERRHHCLKSTQAVAPVRLHSPARIEALLCCHFLALLVHALIERQIRASMTATGHETISLYPEERDCPAPSAARVLDIFADLARHHLHQDGRAVQTFDPQLDNRQRAVLRLLDIRPTAYQHSR